MSFLDRVEECNRYDLTAFRRFTVAGHRVGWVREDRLEYLRAYPDTLTVSDDSVLLNPALTEFEDRSAALMPILKDLAGAGLIGTLREEPYPVGTGFNDAPFLRIDRAAVPFFGVRAYGVHVNGFVRKADGIHMWIGRRSRNKSTYPGLLDNMVAGGQPYGLGLAENLVKESAEEADIPEDMARRALPVGAITYCVAAPEGLKPDVQFCYDLEVPPDFTPRNTDGEIEEFFLLPVEEVATIVEGTTDFKFNCNLVIIDFLIRHGFIGPDHPDYLALVKGLRQ